MSKVANNVFLGIDSCSFVHSDIVAHCRTAVNFLLVPACLYVCSYNTCSNYTHRGYSSDVSFVTQTDDTARVPRW